MSISVPRVVVDLDRLDANIRRFHDDCPIPVRTHVKAHRAAAVTSRQLAAGAIGIAVQFAREARAHLAVGGTDVVVAWPWPDPWRWQRFAELAALGRVAVHVTTAAAVGGLGAAADAAGTELGVRIQLDGGAGRGVPPEDVVALARVADGTPGVRLDGVTGYAALTSIDQAMAADEHGRRLATLLVQVADAIRADGVECPVVCVGGTPTAAAAATVPGVTEVCAGAYALLDAGLADLGWCDPDDVAIAIEGGATDEEPVRTLLDRCDQAWAPGVVATPGRIGLLPAHTCPMMPRLDELVVVRGGREVDRWPVRCHTDRATPRPEVAVAAGSRGGTQGDR